MCPVAEVNTNNIEYIRTSICTRVIHFSELSNEIKMERENHEPSVSSLVDPLVGGRGAGGAPVRVLVLE